MQKLWRHKNYNEALGCVPIAHEYVLEEIWSSNKPNILDENGVDTGVVNNDYSNITTPDLSIARNKFLYIERKEVGNDFADFMDARLVVLGQGLTDVFNAGYILNDISERCVEILDEGYEKVRVSISRGRWKSAKRKMKAVIVNAELETLITENLTPIGQTSMIDQVQLILDVNAKIDYEITRLY